MKITRFLGACWIACTLVGAAFAQNAGDPAKQEDILAEARRKMHAMIDTKDFEEEMPFARFIEKLNDLLKTEAKIAIRLDREAFGKESDKMLAELVSLPPVPRKMLAGVAIRLAVRHVYAGSLEIEFTARPGEYIITTRIARFYKLARCAALPLVLGFMRCSPKEPSDPKIGSRSINKPIPRSRANGSFGKFARAPSCVIPFGWRTAPSSSYTRRPAVIRTLQIFWKVCVAWWT